MNRWLSKITNQTENRIFSPVTLGKRLKTIDASGFVLTETTHLPNHELPRHHHELTNIAFVLNGSFSEILDRRTIDCYPQSVLVKPSGEPHANRYGNDGMRCLLVEVQSKKLAALGSWSKALDEVQHVRGGASSALGTRIYREFRLMDSASPLAIEGLVLEWIAELCRRSSLRSERRPARWLERAREILHAHSSEMIRLSDIASSVDIHPVHLAREFRKAYGCTLGEYLRSLRIDFCCDRLASSDDALVEIALAVSFSSQSHFSRVFKRHTGMTPTEYRSFYRIPR
jgi:AraC family transcriptional regulator